MRKLAGPGEGLPGFERFYLNLFLRMGAALWSDESVTNDFQRSSQSILKIVDENDIDVLSQVIIVPRLQGIEDNSRNWSVLMVLDHLSQVNRSIMQTIRILRSESLPFDEVRIEDFKPDDDVGADVIEQFRESNQRYWAFAKSHQPLSTSSTFPHPWFGDLDGHGWHCLASAHQKIHRRQILKILALIGVA